MSKLTRRRFVTNVALTGAGFAIVPRHVLGRGFTPPSDTLNVAAVGVGGQGRNNLVNLASENIVALCDVDWDYADTGFKGIDADIASQQERLDRPRTSLAWTRRAGPRRRSPPPSDSGCRRRSRACGA